MVEHVVAALEIDVAAVDGEAVLRLVHYPSPESPGTVDAGSRGVGHVLGHSARRVDKVIGTLALVHPGALLVLGHPLVAAHCPVHLELQLSEGLGIMIARHFLVTVDERHHVVVQLAVPQALVAPEQIGLPVIVDKYGRVDEAETDRERAAYRIGPGALGIVGHGYRQCILAVGGVAAQIPVPFPVMLYRLRRPGPVSMGGPFEGLGRHLCTEIGPVDHVAGAEYEPVIHLEVGRIVFVMVGKEIHRVAVHVRRGIGRIDGAYSRVLGRRQACRCGQQDGREHSSFHVQLYHCS